MHRTPPLPRAIPTTRPDILEASDAYLSAHATAVPSVPSRHPYQAAPMILTVSRYDYTERADGGWDLTSITTITTATED